MARQYPCGGFATLARRHFRELRAWLSVIVLNFCPLQNLAPFSLSFWLRRNRYEFLAGYYKNKQQLEDAEKFAMRLMNVGGKFKEQGKTLLKEIEAQRLTPDTGMALPSPGESPGTRASSLFFQLAVLKNVHTISTCASRLSCS